MSRLSTEISALTDERREELINRLGDLLDLQARILEQEPVADRWTTATAGRRTDPDTAAEQMDEPTSDSSDRTERPADSNTVDLLTWLEAKVNEANSKNHTREQRPDDNAYLPKWITQAISENIADSERDKVLLVINWKGMGSTQSSQILALARNIANYNRTSLEKTGPEQVTYVPYGLTLSGMQRDSKTREGWSKIDIALHSPEREWREIFFSPDLTAQEPKGKSQPEMHVHNSRGSAVSPAPQADSLD